VTPIVRSHKTYSLNHRSLPSSLQSPSHCPHQPLIIILALSLQQHQSQSLIHHHLSQHQSDLNSKTPFFMSNMTHVFTQSPQNTETTLSDSATPVTVTQPSNNPTQPSTTPIQPSVTQPLPAMVIILALSLQQHQSLSLQQHQPQSPTTSHNTSQISNPSDYQHTPHDGHGHSFKTQE